MSDASLMLRSEHLTSHPISLSTCTIVSYSCFKFRQIFCWVFQLIYSIRSILKHSVCVYTHNHSALQGGGLSIPTVKKTQKKLRDLSISDTFQMSPRPSFTATH